MKSYKALETEQVNGDPNPEGGQQRRTEDHKAFGADHDDEVVMYRGRPVRKSAGGTPGAGSASAKGRQFRGATGAKKKKSSDPSVDQLKAALKKLNELHAEGLITQTEFNAKRRQILDRL